MAEADAFQWAKFLLLLQCTTIAGIRDNALLHGVHV